MLNVFAVATRYEPVTTVLVERTTEENEQHNVPHSHNKRIKSTKGPSFALFLDTCMHGIYAFISTFFVD